MSLWGEHTAVPLLGQHVAAVQASAGSGLECFLLFILNAFCCLFILKRPFRNEGKGKLLKRCAKCLIWRKKTQTFIYYEMFADQASSPDEDQTRFPITQKHLRSTC